MRGNDFEGVLAMQSEWMGWSEGLPRKLQGEAGATTDEQGQRRGATAHSREKRRKLPPPLAERSLRLAVGLA